MRPLPLLLCLAAVTSACREPAEDDDAMTASDAGPGNGMAGSLVPAIGKDDTIDVICWNVRQFPSDMNTVSTLARLIQSLDVDVVAIMEVADDPSFTDLVERLEGWQGYLEPRGDGYIKLGLLWRTASVTVTGAGTIFEGDHDFPRPPIVATVSHGSGAGMTLVAVHLKAGRTTDDALRRENANTKLAGWVAGRGNKETLLCGDFNEDQDNGYAPTVYASWLAAPQTYRMLTGALDHSGTFTYLPGRIMFDQMIATAALDDELAGQTPLVPPIDKQIGSYQTVISDHLPVAIRVSLH